MPDCLRTYNDPQFRKLLPESYSFRFPVNPDISEPGGKIHTEKHPEFIGPNLLLADVVAELFLKQQISSVVS